MAVKLVSSYTGDISILGIAETFVLRLNAIDACACLVECMLLLEEFPATVQALHEAIQNILDACYELLKNKGLKNFLRLVLITGNFMNSGSYAGNAVGFRLSTLPKLIETRANRPRITLLHYLVDEAQRKDRDSLKFTNELLEKLKLCSRLSLDNLSGEVCQLDATLRRLDNRIQQEGGQLKLRFGTFVQNGSKQILVLKKKLEEIEHLSDQLAKRFCEDEKKFQLEECLNIVSVFCSKIKMAEA
ncbi:FH2 domain-containing protein 1-like, partial [Stegodyphus dumicola]|uniref:FH2 domain-containing protein 1-like n=1 Tax=Stegodyphus dumicola TaxID=202533 RepID=UPI0015B1F629